MLIFLALIGCLAFFAATCWLLNYFVYKRQIAKWEQCNIPFLRPIFLVGHKYVLDVFFRQTPIVAILDRLRRENSQNDVVGFFWGTRSIVLVNNIKLIQEIFVNNFDKTFRSHFVPLSSDIETQSIIPICSDKARWKADRALLAPMFATSRIGGANFEKFEKQMERVLEYAEETRRSDQSLSVHKIANSFVSDSTLWWHFNEYTNSLVERSEVHDALSVRGSLIRHFLVFMCPLLQIFGLKIFPRVCFDKMKTFLERKLENWRDPMRQYTFFDYIASLKEKGVLGKQSGIQSLDQKKQHEIALRQMTGYAWTMMKAGVDPPAHLSIYTIHLLSLYSEYQDKIKKEIDQAMRKHNVSKLTFEVVQELRFTEQCIHEASRLVPYFPFSARRCSGAFLVEDTNYILTNGDLIMACQFTINHDPKNFDNPEKFDPERFNSVKNWNSVTSDVLLSFGVGPRKCPGYNIGITLVVMFVATLLSKYQIKPRSHLRQMTTPADFNPKSASNAMKGDLLVDLIPR